MTEGDDDARKCAVVLGDRLRRVRVERGFTQMEAGARVGWNYSTIGAYERGERDISYTRLCTLCGAYGVFPWMVVNPSFRPAHVVAYGRSAT